MNLDPDRAGVNVTRRQPYATALEGPSYRLEKGEGAPGAAAAVVLETS